ncbi:metallophosphoesterase [Thalassotalea sp. 1_MG-2023]|uniref:metallophosphoesterase family protein n=1 Tax=Thalassotalea sp. 1_MG-2023 TaxID=3062680 RepID=UPI0026E4029E|nr:metallophosphoesterase [Thalassotalea sp. 1_MG-2023]MDO6426562.1 metallophosphoesterase [Thalassotalea sp. 1_MG-2023]
MIIFAFDPHGVVQPLIDACQKLKPTAIILMGDNCLNSPIPITFEKLLKEGVKVYAISGNHDHGSISNLDMPHMLDGKVVDIDGLRIGGYDWSLHDVMCNQHLDIVVSHYPPTGFKDMSHYDWHHSAIKTAELTLKSNAVAVFHGHLHGNRLFDPVGIYDISCALAISTCEHLFDECGNILGQSSYKGFTQPQDDYQYCIAEMMKRGYQYKTKQSRKSKIDEYRYIESAYYSDGCGVCVPCNDNHHCHRETRVDHNFNIDISNEKLNGSASFHFEAAKQRAYKRMLSELLDIRRKVPHTPNFKGFGGLIRYKGDKAWTVLDETHQITSQKVVIEKFGIKTAEKFFDKIIGFYKSSYCTQLLFDKKQKITLNNDAVKKQQFIQFLTKRKVNINQ